MWHHLIVWLIACCVLPLNMTTAAQSDAKTDDQVSRIEALFEDIDAANDPGCAVGVQRGGETILARGFGLANVAFDAPNDFQTAFEIASGSKSFTAACIALLLDQRKISLDDDVRDILPELSLEKPVLIRHLLRCESGVWAQFHIMPLAGWGNVPVQSPYSKEDFFTVLCGQRKLPFEPGSQFQYGSGDTFLLGMIVERVSGESLAQFAKENLFDPLEMTRTWYLEDPGLAVPNRATGHWKSEAGWASGPHSPATSWRQWHATAYLGGGGSLLTTVDDLFKWSRIYQENVLPRGKHIDEFTRLGTVAGNRFVLDVDAYLKHVNQHPDNAPAGEYRGAKRIQITGGYWGFSACYSHFPDHDVTIVCLSNNDSVSGFGKAREIADIVLEDVLEDVPDQPSIAVSNPPPVVTDTQLQALVGSYRQKGNHPIWRIRRTEEGISVEDGFGGVFALIALSETRFAPEQPSPFHSTAVFAFDVGEEGSDVRGLSLSSVRGGMHESLWFRRVQDAAPYDTEALAEFAGTFVSEELGAICRVRVHDGALQLRVGSYRWEPLKALETDEFSPIVKDPHNTRFIRFSRDTDDRVDGFSIGFWRIHGLRFDRISIGEQVRN